jgi:hypothetical protein
MKSKKEKKEVHSLQLVVENSYKKGSPSPLKKVNQGKKIQKIQKISESLTTMNSRKLAVPSLNLKLG